MDWRERAEAAAAAEDARQEAMAEALSPAPARGKPAQRRTITEDLFDASPSRPTSDVVADALTILGERPSGYEEMRRMQYRPTHPDVSDLRKELGL